MKMIVSGGCGIVGAAKYAGSGANLFAIAAGFGISVMMAVYTTRDVSGAHLNPAVTLSLAVNDSENADHEATIPYIASQVAGATVAGDRLPEKKKMMQ